MVQDETETQVVKMVDHLEPYRRLIELQKQMIELVRQHERTKDECASLRKQLLEEMTRTHRLRWRLRQTAHYGIRWLKYLAAHWKSRLASRAQPNVSLLTRNRLSKI